MSNVPKIIHTSGEAELLQGGEGKFLSPDLSTYENILNFTKAKN